MSQASGRVEREFIEVPKYESNYILMDESQTWSERSQIQENVL